MVLVLISDSLSVGWVSSTLVSLSLTSIMQFTSLANLLLLTRPTFIHWVAVHCILCRLQCTTTPLAAYNPFFLNVAAYNLWRHLRSALCCRNGRRKFGTFLNRIWCSNNSKEESSIFAWKSAMEGIWKSDLSRAETRCRGRGNAFFSSADSAQAHP